MIAFRLLSQTPARRLDSCNGARQVARVTGLRNTHHDVSMALLRWASRDWRWLVGAAGFWGLQACVDARVVEELGTSRPSPARPDARAEGGAANRVDAQTPNANRIDASAAGHGETDASSLTRPASGVFPPEGGVQTNMADGGLGQPLAQLALRLERGTPSAFGGAADGVNGPALLSNVCPFDEVLTGLRVWTFTNSTTSRYQAPMGLAAICSSVKLKPQVNGWQLQLTETRQLRRRGDGYSDDAESDLLCPVGTVVVGVGGLTGRYLGAEEDTVVIYIDGVRLLCAEISVDENGQLRIGAAASTPAIGMAQDTPEQVFEHQCPNDSIARGVAVAAGAWIDSFGAVCAQASVRRDVGAVCETPDECISSVCDEGRCAEIACSPEDCDCVSYGETMFAFCGLANWSSAHAACSGSGMELVSLADAAESGWLRGTADALGLADVWIGASDAEIEGVWQWTTGGVFWDNGVPGEGHFAQWALSEPNVSVEANDCALSRGQDGSWAAKDCALRNPFACKR